MNPDNNYWDNLMATDEGAAEYMYSYGEGPGCETRMIISSFINDGEVVLDSGCGPAWNFEHFKEYGPTVTYFGIDLSPRFVRVANKRIGEKYNVEPIELGDCRKLQYDDNMVDVVILQDILEHTNGYEDSVSEALRVAKKRVIVCFWRNLDTTRKTNDDTDKGTDGYGSDYNRGEWEQYLDDTGYSWFHTTTSPEANRQHEYYIIDKVEDHA